MYTDFGNLGATNMGLIVHTVDTLIPHVRAIVMINVELAQACPNNSSDSSWLFSVVSKLIAMK